MTQAKLRVGVVGTSWWADSMYLPALTACEAAELVAVCGRDETRTHDFAQRWSVPQTFTDWQKMIDSGSIDAIVVASTNDTHHPITMAAIDAGLHVLCEKPVGRTTAEAEEMAAAAADAGVTTLVPFTYRYMPIMRHVKQLIDDGFVGRPYHLNLRYYTGFARDGEYSWRFDPDFAGSGVIGDLGSHWLHLARWFMGEASMVGALSTRLIERDARPDDSPYERGEDSAVISLRFPDSAYATLQVSAVCWEGDGFGQSHHLEIHGSEGTVYAKSDWKEVQEVRGVRSGEPGPPGPLPVPDEIWGGARRDNVHDTYRDVFRKEGHMIGEWVEAARAGRQVEPDLAEGARVQLLVDAAVRSSDELGGRLVDVTAQQVTPEL